MSTPSDAPEREERIAKIGPLELWGRRRTPEDPVRQQWDELGAAVGDLGAAFRALGDHALAVFERRNKGRREPEAVDPNAHDGAPLDVQSTHAVK